MHFLCRRYPISIYMCPISKRIIPEPHILKSDTEDITHDIFTEDLFQTERKDERRRMEGRKRKASKFKEETGVWDLKKLQPISKVGKISQSWWIKFPWLPTHRASFQGKEPIAFPHFSPTTPAQHTHNLTLHSWTNTNTSDTKDSKQKPSCTLSWLTLGSTKLAKSFSFW